MVIEGNVTLDFDLPNGVFVFESASAIGKTRLAKLLHEYRVQGQPVASYTYGDKVLGRCISDVFDPKYKVVMLDRYDLYNGFGKVFMIN